MKVILVVVYLSHVGHLDMSYYVTESMQDCATKGKRVKERVKAGRVNTICWKYK